MAEILITEGISDIYKMSTSMNTKSISIVSLFLPPVLPSPYIVISIDVERVNSFDLVIHTIDSGY